MLKHVSLLGSTFIQTDILIFSLPFLCRSQRRRHYYIMALHKALVGQVVFQDCILTMSYYTSYRQLLLQLLFQKIAKHLCQYLSQEVHGKETRLSNWKVMEGHCQHKGVLQLERDHALQRNPVQPKH